MVYACKFRSCAREAKNAYIYVQKNDRSAFNASHTSYHLIAICDVHREQYKADDNKSLIPVNGVRDIDAIAVMLEIDTNKINLAVSTKEREPKEEVEATLAQRNNKEFILWKDVVHKDFEKLLKFAEQDFSFNFLDVVRAKYYAFKNIFRNKNKFPIDMD